MNLSISKRETSCAHLALRHMEATPWQTALYTTITTLCLRILIAATLHERSLRTDPKPINDADPIMDVLRAAC
jgi:hypothetical protein